MLSLNIFFEQVGLVGILLILMGIYAIYLSVHTFFYLHFVWKGFKKDFLSKSFTDKKSILEVCESSSNPLILIIYDIIHIHSNHSEDMRSEIAYLFHRNFEHVSNSLAWLKVISAMAPLLGLLGTVVGMVSIFQNIAGNAGTSSSLLAGGIWTALLTTILGLSIAIPTLFVYYYLVLKFKTFHIESVEHSYMALEICSSKFIRHCKKFA